MKHHILVKWNESVTDKKAVRRGVAALFGALTAMDGISAVDVIPNVIDRPNRYDLMIVLTMTPETLPVYDESEAHRTWKRLYGDKIAAKAIFDAE